MMADWCPQLRQLILSDNMYSNIELAYGRNSSGIYRDICAVMNASAIDVQEVKAHFAKDYRYILIDKSKDIHGDLKKKNFNCKRSSADL